MSHNVSSLNTQQQDAVLHGDGPCLILAGAGSGKTRTIIHRVAYLLEKGIDPNHILLVTFTNKAAKEMGQRLQTLVSSEVHLPWSGTFHHIAYRMLRRYAPLLGFANTISILDSEDSRDLFALCLKQEGVDRKQRRFPSAAVIQSIVSYARNAELPIADVLDAKYPSWIDLAEIIERIAEEYAKRKRDANAMDFDDLLVFFHVLLLKSDRVRDTLSNQFAYILVDEYQDTNTIQASLIRLLSSKHKNVFVVGDDAQSIYSFRAANIEHILRFEQTYPNAKIFRLETNYRSTPDILDVANSVIQNNRAQYQKILHSPLGRSVKPEIHAFADELEEGEYIAETILELRDEGVPLNEIAVLFRAAHHSQALEMELTKRDIPYEYRGGVRFFERAHMKDVLAYLRIVHNPDDAIAWSRVLRMQVGIGPASAETLIAEIRRVHAARKNTTAGLETEVDVFPNGGSVPELSRPRDAYRHLGSVLSARGQVGWIDFLGIWGALCAADGTPAGLIHALMQSKYAEYLEYEYDDARERLQDIEQLAVFAERETNLNQFLAEASLQESYRGVAGAHTAHEEEKLILSTVHQAKGLEWETVFILNVSNGQFPNERAAREEKGIEEERRLFYVAITRAKKLLYFTYPLSGSRSSFLQGPSVFLDEIDVDLVDHQGLVDVPNGLVFSDPSDAVDDIVYEPCDDTKPRKGFLKEINDL
ncbi:MAG TPA: ATP-dependent DNA helicase [Candidatus Magasanikbacteria bacterium]|nr:MAG: hypothetical protein A3I74_04350 [Candidatus Magasanikbacteria bacterium RIFCSPLOWO2_02_FULL_47_16]OGH79386.1 MAG: hypothetical protein A3C10_04885 [Candidatus Magasanikbacteria bacterium RIFCSPHIGHO2_02_FULL_48_18]OGH82496.1 MAG: hypothetical protein A3G08_00760 [Candidatus Magasanikbacteria bacterium RIFCSPLOWO2_12_FULL_47_9b]HAZ28753.1 ATP-dependent DNA helicase [Candidatus Magasanikbacteria bacterium]